MHSILFKTNKQTTNSCLLKHKTKAFLFLSVELTQFLLLHRRLIIIKINNPLLPNSYIIKVRHMDESRSKQEPNCSGTVDL